MQLLPWPNRLRALLLSCTDKTSIAKVHALMILTSTLADGSFNARLIASYVGIGDIVSARKVFDKLPQRGVNAWNAMIVAYSRQDYPSQVLSLYHQMVADGVRPDSSTFTIAIKACASMLDLEIGEENWSRAVDCGYERDVFVESFVLNLYADGAAPTLGDSSDSTTTISPINSHFSALTCRDTLRLIFEKLPIPDLARSSCVCRVWSSVASDQEIVAKAFKVSWNLKEVIGKPASSSFWRDNSIGKFAISHRIVRGDIVASLAVK